MAIEVPDLGSPETTTMGSPYRHRLIIRWILLAILKASVGGAGHALAAFQKLRECR